MLTIVNNKNGANLTWGRFDLRQIWLGPIWLGVNLTLGRFGLGPIWPASLIKYYYIYQTWQLSANLCSSKKFYIHKPHYWSNTITYTKHDSSQPISVLLRNSTYTSPTTDQRFPVKSAPIQIDLKSNRPQVKSASKWKSYRPKKIKIKKE